MGWKWPPSQGFEATVLTFIFAFMRYYTPTVLIEWLIQSAETRQQKTFLLLRRFRNILVHY